MTTNQTIDGAHYRPSKLAKKFFYDGWREDWRLPGERAYLTPEEALAYPSYGEQPWMKMHCLGVAHTHGKLRCQCCGSPVPDGIDLRKLDEWIGS